MHLLKIKSYNIMEKKYMKKFIFCIISILTCYCLTSSDSPSRKRRHSDDSYSDNEDFTKMPKLSPYNSDITSSDEDSIGGVISRSPSSDVSDLDYEAAAMYDNPNFEKKAQQALLLYNRIQFDTKIIDEIVKINNINNDQDLQSKLQEIQNLIDENKNLIRQQPSQSNTTAPLHIAIYMHNTQVALTIIDALLKAGDDIHTSDENKSTPLHLAAYNGKNEIAQFLIDHGASLYIENEFTNENNEKCNHIPLEAATNGFNNNNNEENFPSIA